jgi:Terminase large subunit, T4likevirus-type, N-terminal
MPSILDRCAGGSLLEDPRPTEAPQSPGAAEELRQRILADCLPAQREFIKDESHRILGYIGGFGSGKSFALCAKALILGMSNPGTTAMVAEPSFPMIRTVFIPAMDDALARWEVDYEFRVSPQPEYLIKLPTGPIKLLCQSAENWQRVRGQNISFVLWDEADTSPVDTAQKAGEMFLARMRVGQVNQLAIASTPEGFRYCYRQFEEQKGQDKRLIRVKTMDNPNLPEGFVESLRRNYPPQLIQAYLDGHFVNLASCSVFPDFDRSIHYTDAKPEPGDTLFAGIDLNVGNCLVEICVRRGDAFHFVAEHVYRDTQQIADGLKETYKDWFDRDQLVLIPDAAAKQRSTAAAQESDVGILKRAGHRISMQQSNPLIQDRVNACNVLISQGRVLVGNSNPHLRRSLEQWAYDEKGKVEKGGVGLDDLSHAADAATYAIYRLAAIRQWKTGGTGWRVY